MPLPRWPGIRTGCTPVSVYNEALLVFLWDESHRVAIEASSADFEGGYADDDAEIDKPLKKLAKDGVLIAYELAQDDSVAVEVMVGPPLTKAELSLARWHKPQTAKLNIPSGVLRVDTGNTFPIDSEPDEDEKPGRVTVPRGEYALTLYRLNWDRLSTDGLLAEGDEWTGPHEVIVLTPIADAKPVKGVKPLLRLPEADTSAWKGKYSIEGTTFLGKAMAHDPRAMCFVNMDRPAAVKLGLTPGMLLRLEVSGLTLEAVFVGEGNPGEVRTTWVKTVRGGRTEFGAAYRPIHDPISLHYLVVCREVAAADFPVLKKWVPAKVTIEAERFVVPEGSPLMDDDLDDIDFSGLE